VERLLLPGDWVEVRPAPEILATLDDHHSVDGLPFMPEMLPMCGRRFRVALRAEKTCIHPPQVPLRELDDAVILQGQRCDGASHAGCQLGCMLMWKERWLRRVDGPGDAAPSPIATPPVLVALRVRRSDDPTAWVCQGTELPRATRPGEPVWRPAQYLRFLMVKTFTPAELAGMVTRIGFRRAKTVLLSRSTWSRAAARFIARRHQAIKAPRPGRASAPEAPAFEPGEWVEVKSREEILETLDARGHHRGLAWSSEMLPFCGRRLRVRRRVDRILDETTGRVRDVRGTVILDGSICDRYLGCARGMPFLWRDAWLRRAEGVPRHVSKSPVIGAGCATTPNRFQGCGELAGGRG
jgi:hypothetical protein